MTSVLVTGASGFIGKRLIPVLVQRGYRVIQVDIQNTSKDIQYLDITSNECVDFVRECNPEVVIHLAAQVDVLESFTKTRKDLQTNILGTLNLLLGSAESQVTNFIYINSGGAIYDANQEKPIRESGVLAPLSPYGVSKLAGEYYVQSICSTYGIGWTSLALSNCYGPVQDHFKGVIFAFWENLKKNKQVRINGAQTTRDFVYIDDVIEAINLAILKPCNRRVNISSGIEVSLIELFQMVASLMNKNVSPILNDLRVGEISKNSLDNSLANILLGWAPKFTLYEGLRLSIPEDLR